LIIKTIGGWLNIKPFCNWLIIREIGL